MITTSLRQRHGKSGYYSPNHTRPKQDRSSIEHEREFLATLGRVVSQPTPSSNTLRSAAETSDRAGQELSEAHTALHDLANRVVGCIAGEARRVYDTWLKKPQLENATPAQLVWAEVNPHKPHPDALSILHTDDATYGQFEVN